MDEYGNEIEIFYDEQGNISGSTITNSSGTYAYTAEEMENSPNLLALLDFDSGDVDYTVYSQEDRDWIEKNF